ncbi:hypothetical protein PQ455_14205 [Sphingomonas naphthae]|uniref:Uncharacterized protein n=1 Tax=Sphingomonas naphthae TaxID=1813468 RepID=A0ABY7THS7_9SPHN|nr:hypothetical protein [Sphingomonas naphthae]WCT72781.1 hypothetical protein PQ455_14205 [Sphingomonas naphthae]
MLAALIAFFLASNAGPPPQEVQDEVAYQNCAGTWDPAACQAGL